MKPDGTTVNERAARMVLASRTLATIALLRQEGDPLLRRRLLDDLERQAEAALMEASK